MKIRKGNDGAAEQLDSLIHKMGNALSAATIAHKMSQEGREGSSKALSECLENMWQLINSAQAEIGVRRNQAFPPIKE